MRFEGWVSVKDEKTVATAVQTAALRRVDIATILGTAREIILLHNGAEYRLRLTSNDKLILTK